MRVIFAVASSDFAMLLQLDNNVMNMLLRLLLFTSETKEAPHDNKSKKTDYQQEK
jgi:hypothetical protein